MNRMRIPVRWTGTALAVLLVALSPTPSQAVVTTRFPVTTSGNSNPEIQWKGSDNIQYRLILGWKSTSSQTLKISQTPTLSGGKITVKTQSTCHGCMIRLYWYNQKTPEWIKLGEVQALANTDRTITANAPAAPTTAKKPTVHFAQTWPAKVTGSYNPEIQWEASDKHIYKVTLGWDHTSSKYLQIAQEPTIIGNTMTVKATSDCNGCMARLYIMNVSKWQSFGEVQMRTGSTGTISAAVPKAGVENISYGINPQTGTVLEIIGLKSYGGTQVVLTVSNKTNYFYGLTVFTADGKKTKILGGKEQATLEFNSSVSPIAVYFYHIRAKAQLSLGLFYLQALYTILFQDAPPTTFMDGMLSVFSQYANVDATAFFEGDGQALIWQFVTLMKDNDRFRKAVLNKIGKGGAEASVNKSLAQLTAVKGIIDKANALGYMAGSLRMPDSETRTIESSK